MEMFGIDIGGSGIKGALVDTETGALISERTRIETPEPSKPEAMVETAAAVVREGGWDGPVGCGFPAVIKDGVVQTAANIDESNKGFDFRGALESELGVAVHLVNDGDAAGMAESRWGAGKDVPGLVFMVTLGTGLGTSLFINGHLVPNTELGHIEIRGKDAEERSSDRTRKQKNLSWKKYGERLDEYLRRIEDLLWPDLIILGGGISKKSDRFMDQLSTRTEITIAKMHNEAGIAGAALAGIPEQEKAEKAPV